jgi:fucose permease
MARALLLTQYFGFTTLGFILSMTSPMIESIRSDIAMNYTRAGTVLTGQFMGAFLTIMLGGYLADRFGKKPFLIAGSVFITAGLMMCVWASSFPMLFAACLITGVGTGSYEVGINALVADNMGTGSGKAMNYLHFFFGVGAIAAPVAVTSLFAIGTHWRTVFMIAILLPVIFSVLLAPQKVGNAKTHPADTSNTTIYRNGTLWLFGFVIFVYVGIETATCGWIPSFWKQVGQGSVVPYTIIASVFWGTLTAGRLVCGLIADRIGLVRFIAWSSIVTMLSGAVWSVFPGKAVTLAFVFVTGFSLSGIYPTVMAYMTKILPGRSGKVVAFMSVLASIGGFFIPSLIGKIADMHTAPGKPGITVLPLSIFVLSIMMCGAVHGGTILALLKSAVRRVITEKK